MLPAVRLELVATIDLGARDGYRSAALEMPPPAGLTASRPVAFALISGGWHGRATIEGSPDDCERDVGIHLGALRALSRIHTAWRFRIELEPDGGVLELVGGSFGVDDEEVDALLRWTQPPPTPAEGARGTLYVSVRLPEDAHAHFLDLVRAGWPAQSPAPTWATSLEAIAIGFELDGDAERTSRLLGVLRAAWLQEGSRAECFVELESETPIVRRVHSLREWRALDRALRVLAPADAPGPASAAPTAEPAPPIRGRELTRVAALPVLADRVLTWLDAEGRVLSLCADGILRDSEDRIEALLDANDWRRRDLARCVRPPRYLRDLPREPHVDRRDFGSTLHGHLFGDRRGPDTRLCCAVARGVVPGPVLRNIKTVVISSYEHYALAIGDIAGASALVTVWLNNLRWDHCAPWPVTSTVTDLAPRGRDQVVAVANLGDGGELYVIEALTGALVRTVDLPCCDPIIVCADGHAVWLTGRSPSGAADRYDLVHVDLAASVTSVLTAGIRARGWGPLHALRRRDGWLLAYAARGVFALGDELEAVTPIAPDEELSWVADHDGLLAVFTAGSRGARLVLGDAAERVIELPSPGFAPLLAKLA